MIAEWPEEGRGTLCWLGGESCGLTVRLKSESSLIPTSGSRAILLPKRAFHLDGVWR
jgi:hypothetical protein